MRYGTLELRVGFTIFIAALILIIGMMWFQGFKISRDKYQIYAVFPMVGGIGRGDAVNVNGVEYGEVRNVVLRERDVLITMELDHETRIPDDSRVILQTLGIMGEREINIIMGESDGYLEPGSIIEGVYDPGISEALAAMGNMMEDLTGLVIDTKKIAAVLVEGGNLEKTIENLAALTDELRGIVDGSAPEIREGIRSFRSSTGRVDDFLGRNEARLDTMAVSMERVAGELPSLVEQIRSVTESLARIARKLESDESSIGSMIQDRELADRLERTITNLDDLITDIKANPKRYLTVEIF